MENITFESVKIGLASPETIREKWSYGEVTKPETINYRSSKPEPGGLFCEVIFGPVRDYTCSCGTHKKIHEQGQICEKCHVEVTKSSVRRYRMGHIELACPVTHIWYLKNHPPKIASLLNVPIKELEKVVYYGAYIVINPGSVDECKKGQVIDHKTYERIKEYYYDDTEFKVGMGAAAVRELLAEIDPVELEKEIRGEFKTATSQKREEMLERLAIVSDFAESGNRPEWMVLTVLPVIPPDLRPMIQLDGGRYAISDLNDLYCKVINRNNRLKRFLDDESIPTSVLNNEKRLLQEAVDALLRPMIQLDSGRYATSDLYRKVINRNNRLKKLLDDESIPASVLNNEKRLLQVAVDALININKSDRPQTGANIPFRYVQG